MDVPSTLLELVEDTLSQFLCRSSREKIHFEVAWEHAAVFSQMLYANKLVSVVDVVDVYEHALAVLVDDEFGCEVDNLFKPTLRRVVVPVVRFIAADVDSKRFDDTVVHSLGEAVTEYLLS